MTDQSEFPVIDVLKRTMRRRSLRLTDVAERSGIPYRSLQNYFSRRTQMPVTAYLKICGVLGLDADYVDRERFTIDLPALKIALQDTLGHLIPHYVTTPESMTAIDPRTILRSADELRTDLNILATFVVGAYDQARELTLSESLADDEQEAKGEVPQ